MVLCQLRSLHLNGSSRKSEALISIPNSRVLIARTPTRRTPEYIESAKYEMENLHDEGPSRQKTRVPTLPCSLEPFVCVQPSHRKERPPWRQREWEVYNDQATQKSLKSSRLLRKVCGSDSTITKTNPSTGPVEPLSK